VGNLWILKLKDTFSLFEILEIFSVTSMNKVTYALSTVLLTYISGSAFAGPDWDEGAKDAGATPTTAQPVAVSTNTAVTKVRGGTSATALVGTPDLVDIYLVKTGSNPNLFLCDMNMGPGGAPAWNARLTILKKTVVNCGNFNVTLGFPIATVVKASASSPWPILDGSVLVNNPTGGPPATLGSLMAANTEYYVAVSGLNNLPIGLNSDCSSTGSTKTLFLNTTGFGIYAIPTNDAPYHLTSWTDPATAETGAYSIPADGMYPIPASSCDVPARANGPLVLKAFDFAFAPAMPGTIALPCAPTWYPNREFFFLWTANCGGPAEVSTCGLTLTDSGIEVFEINACNPDLCASAASPSIACNDQCGTGDASLVTFTAESGRQYLVRLTRLSGFATTGTIKFTCTPALGSRDINGDGIVDATDLAYLIGSWGTSGN
jgi:hypothetical protein